MLQRRADFGERGRLAAKQFAENAQAEFAADDRGLLGLGPQVGRLVKVARDGRRAGREPCGLAREVHEPVVGEFVAQRVEAFALVLGKDRPAELERPEGAGDERGKLGRVGRREVEHDHPDGLLAVDEVHVAELALDHHGLAGVGGGGRCKRIRVHHIDARVLQVDRRGRQREHFDFVDRPEEARRLLLGDPRDRGVASAAEDGEIGAHIGRALREGPAHGLGGEGELHLDDGHIRAVLGDHMRPIGGPQ